MTEALSLCDRCDAILAPWERTRCCCTGPQRTANAELLYAAACTVAAPIHVRDYVRLVKRDYGQLLTEPTANATLGPDPRFCWAGKGLYGLYRHGPLPGPRNLHEVARLTLYAAGQPLTIDALDFTLKRLGYRYNVASLSNAISRSYRIQRRPMDGLWEHPCDGSAERLLRSEIRTVPTHQRAAWKAIVDRLAVHVQAALTDRQSRLHDLGNAARFSIDWATPITALTRD